MTNAEMTEKTKSSIIDALFLLMEKHDYSEITMTSIAAEAEVGRATVYRYYGSKEDIIRDYFDRNKRMFFDIEHAPIQKKEDYYNIIIRVFSVFKDNKKPIQLLMKAHLEFLYLNFLNAAMERNFADNNYADSVYSSYYFAGSLFNVSMEWLRRDCEDTTEALADFYYDYIFTPNKIL